MVERTIQTRWYPTYTQADTKIRSLTRVLPTVVSSREEDVALKEVALPRYCLFGIVVFLKLKQKFIINNRNT
jgi:hypothetical protein